MHILWEQNKESKAAGPTNIRAFLQNAHFFLSVHIIVQKFEHVHILSLDCYGEGIWPLVLNTPSGGTLVGRDKYSFTSESSFSWIDDIACREASDLFFFALVICCNNPDRLFSFFLLVVVLVVMEKVVCLVASVSGCDASVIALTVSSRFSAKLPLNLGSTKLDMFRTFFISSVYLSCINRSSLITFFICWVRVQSSSWSWSISLLMCSKTSFREESVTCFSEARTSVRRRGQRSWLTFSRTVMSMSLGIRCFCLLLAPHRWPVLLQEPGNHLNCGSSSGDHIVCQWMLRDVQFCLLLLKLTFSFPALRKPLHQMSACSGSGFHPWDLEDFGNGHI